MLISRAGTKQICRQKKYRNLKYRWSKNIGLQRKGSSKRKGRLEAVVGSKHQMVQKTLDCKEKDRAKEKAVVGSKHQGGESSRERFELSWCESRGAHLGEGMIEPQCG